MVRLEEASLFSSSAASAFLPFGLCVVVADVLQVVHMTLPPSAIGEFPDTKLNRLWLLEATRQFVVCKEQITFDDGRCYTDSTVTFSMPLHCTYGMI